MMCCNEECERKTFQLEYKNNVSRLEIKAKIVEIAVNGAGVRDTGRILGISVCTVIRALKKLKMMSKKLMKSI